MQQLYYDQIKGKDETNSSQCLVGGIELQDQTSMFSIYNRSESSSTKLNGNFLWFQLLIEILLRLSFTIAVAKKELVNVFKEAYYNDEAEKQKINEFDRDYLPDHAIKWYTKDFCLYRLLNKALRRQDIDLLYSFRMCIADIYRQLANEHKKLKESSPQLTLHVYRSQAISKAELERIKQSTNEFLSMNSFFSTSRNEEQALSFVSGGEPTADLVYVLFSIEADLTLNSKPFADINNLSAFEGEEEVLFMLGTIFRIKQVNFNQQRNLWVVSLELCGQDDHDLNSIFQHFKNDFGEKTSLWHLTDLLFDMNEIDRAEKFYHRLIDDVSEYEAAVCYDALGVIAHRKADYNLASMYHNKALKYFKTIFPDDHPVLAYSYEHIGAVEESLSNYDLALKNYEEAVVIWLMAYGDKHIRFARCLINIGLIYDKKKDFSKALANYFCALEIHQQNELPDDHPLFGLLFNNIGYIYFQQDDYDEALIYYEKSLEIRLKSLPSLHTDIGFTYHNIAALYFNQGKYLQALQYYTKGHEIYQHAYESTHPSMILLQNDITKCSTLIVSHLFVTFFSQFSTLHKMLQKNSICI